MKTSTFFFLASIYCVIMQLVHLGTKDETYRILYFIGALLCLGISSILDEINNKDKGQKGEQS